MSRDVLSPASSFNVYYHSSPVGRWTMPRDLRFICVLVRLSCYASRRVCCRTSTTPRHVLSAVRTRLSASLRSSFLFVFALPVPPRLPMSPVCLTWPSRLVWGWCFLSYWWDGRWPMHAWTGSLLSHCPSCQTPVPPTRAPTPAFSPMAYPSTMSSIVCTMNCVRRWQMGRCCSGVALLVCKFHF